MALKYPKPAKGTATRTRRSTRRSKEAQFRDAVWQRDGRGAEKRVALCSRCEKRWVERGVDGEVDHIKPRSSYPELAFDPMNGRIVCRKCNVYFKRHPLERDL